jgi:hexosaminidase
MRRSNIFPAALACLSFAALVASGCQKRPVTDSSAARSVAPSIVPAPADVQSGNGSYSVSAATPVVYGGDAAEVAVYFHELARTVPELAALPAPTTASETGGIHFTLLPRESAVDPDSYTLDISPRGVAVSAADSRGLFYGAVTLWQLLTAQTAASDGIALPAMTIRDTPRFPWRGLMLDSARHYQSPEFVKRLIDQMALHKLNVLHWHLTDDQGWRLEIKKYPRLTEVGAWRVPAGPAAAADIDPATGKSRLYGGFYTQEQVRDIVAHARARHITIVPEIDMPGHASAAVAAYPELAVIEHPPRQVPADWGVYRTLFNVEERTFMFLEDVLGEVVELFPGEYVHVGGDEAVKDQWQASKRVQARMRELGVQDEHAMQSYFISRMEQFLAKHDRRLIGWDEILEGGLAPNATVMSWRGIDGAVAAAAAGHDAVLSPAPVLYLDNRPLDTPTPPGRGRIVGVEDIYRFDPAPAALTEPQRKHILGLQANLWTEHVRTEDRAEYMLFPRVAALAEVAWSPANRLDWASFESRLPTQLNRYRALGVRYARAPEAIPASPTRRGSHRLQTCTDKLVLSLEDDAPRQGDRAVFLIDIMNPCWLWRDADLSQATVLNVAVGQVTFNFQIGDDVRQIPLRKPATAAGELEVRARGCAGEKIATLPLAPAVGNFAVTKLPSVTLRPRAGKQDLCFMFTQASVDPMWAIDSVELVPAPAGAAASE